MGATSLLSLLVLLSPSFVAPTTAPPPVEGVAWKVYPREDAPDIEYAVVLPPGFDAKRSYPCVLAFPPGSQSRSLVEWGLRLYWTEKARERGWIVVSPAAPEGVLYFQGAEAAIPGFLDHVLDELPVEAGRFHVAGPSNGGKSAFRVAGLHPERFLSLTALPGYPPAATDEERLMGLLDTPMYLLVGGEDRGWVKAMEATRKRITEHQGLKVRWRLFPGEGHTPESLTGSDLFDFLEEVHEEVRHREAEETAIASVLDDFHRAASQADGDRYFAAFAPGAIFLGTDATERWTVAQFRAYALPYFEQGRGWTYHPTFREVWVSRDRRTAWFDERLHNDKYGEVRGTGALRKLGRHWKIAQYNLAFPVPNELTKDLVEKIRELQR